MSETTTMIDGWKCVHDFPGTDWSMRTASRGFVSVEADSDGIRLDESGMGYQGGIGSYSIPANVFMWLAQAVRL